MRLTSRDVLGGFSVTSETLKKTWGDSEVGAAVMPHSVEGHQETPGTTDRKQARRDRRPHSHPPQGPTWMPCLQEALGTATSMSDAEMREGPRSTASIPLAAVSDPHIHRTTVIGLGEPTCQHVAPHLAS